MVDQRVNGVGVKRRLPHIELIQYHAEAPQVHRVVVGLLLHQLRRHVQRGALDGGEHHRVAGHGPREAKVAELHGPIAPDEDVLRFHVPVDDPVGVEVVQRSHQLLCDHLHDLLRQILVILEDLKELSLRVLGHDAEVGLRLKSIKHLYDAFVSERAKDFNFLPEVLQVLLALAMLHNELHSSDLTSIFPPPLVHLPKRAFPNKVYDVIVLHSSQKCNLVSGEVQDTQLCSGAFPCLHRLSASQRPKQV
mmetsp:Transcript_23406/g.56011  ORF Transcript_23406/g.56011 Transcript_23406/m.56011 type:complete len:249 (-) Transcript_23406:293-1039(-)